MKFSLEKKIIIAFVFATIALFSVLVIFYTNVQKTKVTGIWVEHTHEVLHKSDNILIDVLNIETGGRGYILTGDEVFLESYTHSAVTVLSNISELAMLTKDNPNQGLRIDSLLKAVNEKLVFTEKIIAMKRNNELVKDGKIEFPKTGKYIADRIRKQIRNINSEEFRLLKQRRKADDESNKNLLIMFALLLVFIVIVLSLVVALILKNQKVEEKMRKYSILESKAKEMEQFAYITSHDLREPLLTIINYIKLLNLNNASALNDDEKKYMEFISKSANRMDVLINGLLDYSRLSRAKQLQDNVDCNEIVKDVLSDLNSLIVTNEAKIIVERLPILKAYPLELKLLFQNLINNAVKFRKEDVAPVINVSSRKINNGWQFEVRDNGIGIDEKNYEKVFVIFQRLHNRNKYEGTGIGLAHCKKIVELHHGTIWVESKLGESSSFYFTILN